MNKLLSWLFPDYSNFGIMKITEEQIETDLDIAYRNLRASGYTPQQATANAIAEVSSKVNAVGRNWSERVLNNLYKA